MADRRQFLRTLGGAAALSFTANIRSFGSARQLSMSMAMPNTGEHDRLQPEWYQRKIKQVQTEMKKHRLNAMVLLHASNVIYTTGYFHLSTERPLAVLIPKSGEPVLFIPGLETDQVKLGWIKDFESYFDYPGPENRVRWIFERVAKRGLSRGRIGIEDPPLGRLRQVKAGAPSARIVVAGELIERMRYVKDDDEIAIMRRAMEFADFTVQAGREFVASRGSVTEDEILKASADAVA